MASWSINGKENPRPRARPTNSHLFPRLHRRSSLSPAHRAPCLALCCKTLCYFCLSVLRPPPAPELLRFSAFDVDHHAALLTRLRFSKDQSGGVVERRPATHGEADDLRTVQWCPCWIKYKHRGNGGAHGFHPCWRFSKKVPTLLSHWDSSQSPRRRLSRELSGTVDHGTPVSTSLELKDLNLDLEMHVEMDPHVETSREELELGLRSSIISGAVKEVQDPGYKVDESTVMGAGPNGSIRASSTSATDLQQAEVALAAAGPDSHPDKMSWPQISVYNASCKGTGGEDDLLGTINLTSDEVHHGDAAIFRQPRNAVPTSYSVLPLERFTGIFKYNHKAVKDASPEINFHETDAPICKLTQAKKDHEKVMPIVTKSENGSKDTFLQERNPETLSVECTEANPKPPSVHKEHSIGKVCAEVEYSGPTEAAQVESQGPSSESGALPTTFSGLFQSILAPENPSSQLVETASLPNGLLATSTVSGLNNKSVKDIANTATRLMLDSLNQPQRRAEPPGLLRVENAPGSSNRMKSNTAVPALGGRLESLPIRSASQPSYREARVASVATTVSAAASAAKNAVQAAEASIEALAILGINNGSLYQGRNSFLNPRPLQVAPGSRPVAAGVKRTLQDQRPPIAEQNGGKSTTGALDFIKIGSTVEVMPEEDGLQGGWFIAKVLSMTPREALVVYDDLMTDDGRSQLEETFPLHCPREEDTFGTTVSGAQGWIRPVHPFSSSQKRGHLTMVRENWVVGDHVDAFVDDGWWEGIIEDLKEADETRITVFFPGDNSTTVLRAWNVRPSLIWKKGEWRPCRGDSVEQDGPPSKRQKTSTAKGKVERDQTKTKVAATRNRVQEHKKTADPRAIAPTRQSPGVSRGDNKGVVLYSKNTVAGQVLVTPPRELRSGTRSQTKAPVSCSKTPASKKSTVNAPTSKGTINGSSPLTRSQQLEVAVTPEPSWDVRRLSTRSQQKESQSPQDVVRGKPPSSRSSKKEVLVSPETTVRGKTPSTRSQHKEAIETHPSSAGGKALAIVPFLKEEPQIRARTRSQISAAKKG